MSRLVEFVLPLLVGMAVALDPFAESAFLDGMRAMGNRINEDQGGDDELD